MKLNKNKLEKTLISNWTSFIDVKDVIKFLNTQLNKKINFLTITKFELIDLGFIVWFEYKTETESNFVEILINLNGEFIILQ